MRARVVIRERGDRLRRRAAFAISAALHGCVLAWLAAATAPPPMETSQSTYEQEIRPNESRLVWYNLRDRLPDVRPSESAEDRRPPRASGKFPQQLVAGSKDDRRAQQMIRMAAPKLELAKALPLPNVLAVAPPKPRRAFTPPAVAARRELPPPLLPEAPKLSTAGEIEPLELGAALPRPQPRPFTPPVAQRAAPSPAMLPDAPRLGTSVEMKTVALEASTPRPRREFTAPAEGEKPAPELVSLEAPAEPAELLDARAPEYATASLAVVGLTPAKTIEMPRPPGAHDAGFSAGPVRRPEGGSGSRAHDARLVVPGLLATGGAKDAMPTLAAALAPPMPASFPGSIPPPAARTAAAAPERELAARVSSAPDPRWQGREIYTVAIQMPNVTSYSGSWIVWFAEHEPLPGAPPLAMKPPLPLRKVDPKYIVTAMEEGVEGTVRLSAVVRKDGRVEEIEFLKRLDARLDRSAEEALSKWIFEPAERDGRPVDIDAVFEIPFRLAPKPKR